MDVNEMGDCGLFNISNYSAVICDIILREIPNPYLFMIILK